MSQIFKATRELLQREPLASEPGSALPCCTFVSKVCLGAADRTDDPEFEPGSLWWRRANVWEAHEVLSPVYAYTRLGTVAAPDQGGSFGVGGRLWAPQGGEVTLERVESYLSPGWWVVQGWRRLTPSRLPPPGDTTAGHQFLMLVLEGSAGHLLHVLESTRKRAARFNGHPLIPGQPLEGAADHRSLEQVFGEYKAAVGLVPLWRDA